MSRKHHVQPGRPTGSKSPGWRLPGAILGGLAAVAAGLLLYQAVYPRGADSADGSAAAKAKGADSAPVVLTEWGDFQ
jgi:hypothetical protein